MIRRVPTKTPALTRVPIACALYDELSVSRAARKLAVALPPFDMPGFDLKVHWHRRFDNEPRSRWLRDQIITVIREDRRATVPPR